MEVKSNGPHELTWLCLAWAKVADDAGGGGPGGCLSNLVCHWHGQTELRGAM